MLELFPLKVYPFIIMGDNKKITSLEQERHGKCIFCKGRQFSFSCMPEFYIPGKTLGKGIKLSAERAYY